MQTKGMIWNKGDNYISFFSFSYILKPRQIRISIISKHDVPTSRPIGKVGLKARNSSKSIFYIMRTFKVLQTFHIDRTIVVTNNCTQIQWWFYPKHVEFILHVHQLQQKPSTRLDNLFFLKGQDREITNKSLAPCVCSRLVSFSARFPCKDSDNRKKPAQVFCDGRFSPEKRMQNSCWGFVTTGNPGKAVPYAGAFVS